VTFTMTLATTEPLAMVARTWKRSPAGKSTARSSSRRRGGWSGTRLESSLQGIGSPNLVRRHRALIRRGPTDQRHIFWRRGRRHGLESEHIEGGWHLRGCAHEGRLGESARLPAVEENREGHVGVHAGSIRHLDRRAARIGPVGAEAHHARHRPVGGLEGRTRRRALEVTDRHARDQVRGRRHVVEALEVRDRGPRQRQGHRRAGRGLRNHRRLRDAMGTSVFAPREPLPLVMASKSHAM